MSFMQQATISLQEASVFQTQNHSTAESVGSPQQNIMQRKMSKGSANRNMTIDTTTLPSVKHRRG